MYDLIVFVKEYSSIINRRKKFCLIPIDIISNIFFKTKFLCTIKLYIYFAHPFFVKYSLSFCDADLF